MNRLWPIRLGLVLGLAAICYAVYRHYIGPWAVMVAVVAVLVIVVAVRKRRGELRPYPPTLRRLPLWRLALIGAGMILGSFAWLVFGFLFFDHQNAQNAYVTMIPFTVLLVVGLIMVFVSLYMKFVQTIWDKV